MLQSNYFQNNIELNESVVETQQLKTSLWLDSVLFTPQWWIGLCLSILPWIIWFLVSQKDSRNRLLYSGFIIIIIASFLDFLGVQFGLWLYNYEVFPWMPAYLPWDSTLVPVIVISLIEYKPHFSPLLKALIFAFLSSFVGGNIFEYFDFYKRIHWETYYSFPIYFFIFLIGYWTSLRDNYAHFKIHSGV
ncbi:CBO0543 family protein [Aquibacillus saliphilus]|uniref:CBO0543 family protein n=1 Tax=Aquibacillus saliphilus TaxID=1909422 RepID=UPI001CF0B02D